MSDSDNGNEHIPLPEGVFGLPGMSDGSPAHEGTHTPPAKKQQKARHKEDQAKKSRKINRQK
jgi:hypothetical protein